MEIITFYISVFTVIIPLKAETNRRSDKNKLFNINKRGQHLTIYAHIDCSMTSKVCLVENRKHIVIDIL